MRVRPLRFVSRASYGVPARLSRDRHCHPRLHVLLALPQNPPRRCAPLDAGGRLRGRGGQRDVLEEGRRRRCWCARPIAGFPL